MTEKKNEGQTEKRGNLRIKEEIIVREWKKSKNDRRKKNERIKKGWENETQKKNEIDRKKE